jgi:hypothetical protein
MTESNLDALCDLLDDDDDDNVGNVQTEKVIYWKAF